METYFELNMLICGLSMKLTMAECCTPCTGVNNRQIQGY